MLVLKVKIQCLQIIESSTQHSQHPGCKRSSYQEKSCGCSPCPLSRCSWSPCPRCSDYQRRTCPPSLAAVHTKTACSRLPCT
ncbi:hypothetical protein FGO68_gene17249 [Halteria grandinella]|uniref:Uncharacterized protein n=1 Tax=Halteria grandinella TaxID=5974 RepID=A0A8J8SUQ0_HALGN|nr:hypothetical protein FGO68_gene17249 [Halteria grandinella]